MTLKTFSRAGLLALAGAIVLAIVLSLPTFHASYAQTAATPAAPATTAPAATPAAAPAEAPPPACDAKTLEKCTPNSGDTAWMLTSMAIVLMMTIPGLALFYGGMVRKKNVGDTVMTSFAITCLISILWLFFTYSLAFRAGTPFIGGLDRAFLQGIVSDFSKKRRQSQSAGADDTRDRLFDVPVDLRDHHRGTHCRLVRGAHEILGDAVVHRTMGDLRLFAGRALGLGTGRHLQFGQ